MTYPVFVEMYNPTLITTIRVAEQAVDDYLALGWLLSDTSGGTNTGPDYLTQADTDVLYEPLITRDGSTAGQVPVLQADGGLMFGSPTATVAAEDVQDIVGAMVTGGGATYDDTAGTLNIPGGSGSGFLTDVAATKTTNTALTVGQHNPVDATSGTRTMTLPTGQTAGKLISVEKVDATTNPVVISGSIRGVTTTIQINYQYQTMIFIAAASGTWRPIIDRRSDSTLDAIISADVAAAPLNDDDPITQAFDVRYLQVGDAIDLYASLPIETTKPANQSVTSSTTAAADADLILPVDTNTSYQMYGFIPYEAATAGDLKLALSLPTGATASWRVVGANNAATASPTTTYFDLLTETGVGVSAGLGAGVGVVVEIRGVINIGTNAGSVALKWAQNASSATPTIVYKDAYLSLRRTKSNPAPPTSGLTQILNADKMTYNGETFTAQSPDQLYSLGVNLSPAYARFELRTGDQWKNDIPKGDGRQRISLRGNTYQPFGTDVWWAGSVRVTANSFRSDNTAFYNEIFTFYHNVEGTESGAFKKAELNISIRPNSSGQMRLQVNTAGDPTGASVSTSAQVTTRYDVDFTPYIGQWINFVGRMRFNWNATLGQAQLWKDGTQLFNVTDSIGYNDVKGPYVKHGIYRTGSTFGAVIEWANFKIGTTSLSGLVTAPDSVPGYAVPVPVDS